jgi:hypothetical protein
MPPNTVAYNKAFVPITIMGGIVHPSAMKGNDLWWDVLRAIMARETTDAGSFYHMRIQNWLIRSMTPGAVPLDAGGIAGTFMTQIDFEVNCDIRTDGTP